MTIPLDRSSGPREPSRQATDARTSGLGSSMSSSMIGMSAMASRSLDETAPSVRTAAARTPSSGSPRHASAAAAALGGPPSRGEGLQGGDPHRRRRVVVHDADEEAPGSLGRRPPEEGRGGRADHGFGRGEGDLEGLRAGWIEGDGRQAGAALQYLLAEAGSERIDEAPGVPPLDADADGRRDEGHDDPEDEHLVDREPAASGQEQEAGDDRARPGSARRR